MKQVIDHEDEKLKVTQISPKGTTTTWEAKKSSSDLSKGPLC